MSHTTPPDDSEATGVPKPESEGQYLLRCAAIAVNCSPAWPEWYPSPDGSHEVSTSGGDGQ